MISRANIANVTSHRVVAYLAIAALGIGLFALAKDSSGVSGEEFHTLLEVSSTLLALNVGILSLVRFHARKNNTFLFIGVGFFNTALLDGYHAVVSSSFFNSAFPEAPTSLTSWSWLASRVFLGVLLWLSWLAWRREEKLGESGKVGERDVYAIIGLLTIQSFLFFAIVQLPRVYQPTFTLSRPIELAPALFFLLALIGYLHKRQWKQDDFEHWLVISLIIGLFVEIPFMLLSSELFDTAFYIAHALKMLSYAAVLIGLVTNIYDLFKRTESQEEALRIAIDELKGSQAQLVQSEKMTAIGTMTAGVAHELNNPMMGILNFSQYCAERTDEDDRRYPILKDIEKETQRCIGIVQGLLTFSRMEAGGEEAYSWDDCVLILGRVFDLLEFRIEKEKVIVTQEVDEDIPLVWMKANNVQQVFFNLVVNALDALREVDKGLKELKIAVRNEDEFLKIEFSDNAGGISPQNLEKIFDPFFTTKPVGRGTGLGLSISYGIVKNHGGDMRCESELGLGTRFVVALPIERVSTEVT